MSSYIEASAGTGKTYTIEHKVLDLVKNKGVDLDKILIVTYTEKAAGELRRRIRDILTEENCQEALAKVDNAAIHTIHSFCQKVLQEYAFEAGQPFNQALVDDSEISTLIEKKIRDEWAKEICDQNIDPQKLSSLLIEASKLYHKEMKIYTLPFQFAKANSYQDLLNIDGMSKLLDDIRLDPKASKSKSIKNKLNDLQGWKQGDVFFSGIGDKSFEDPAVAEEFKKFKTLSKVDPKMDMPLLNFVLTHLEALVDEWGKYKAENGLQSYNDMIMKVRDRLNDSNFLTLLWDRFSHAIIDEFQDTNALQWDIFKKIFLDADGHDILVVGDPKQSIFSFQGADLNVYKSAIKEIGDDVKEDPLLTNYRSTNSMIKACNAIFKTSGFLDALHFKESDSPDEPNVKAEPTFDGQPMKPLMIQTDGDARVFAERVAKKIIELASLGDDNKTRLQVFDRDKCKQLRNVSLRDFAVIYRTRKEAYEMERAFRKYGIL
jgi:exodeoxyribonuclease V beta subunit